MRKFFLILPVILLISSRAFSQAEISLVCPDSWGPGRYSKVTVKVTFEKTDGFARFTQEFPVGFEILKDEITQGDFSWNGTMLNVVWMRIPASGKTSFSYYIKPDKQLQGVIDLGGKVVTVTGGSRKETFLANNKQITIGGSGGLLPEEMEKENKPQIVTNVTNSTARPGNNSTTGISGTFYRVQVGTSSEELTADAMKKKLGIVSQEKMTIVKSGGIFKYQMGEFRDKESAVRFQKQLVSMGIKDAFVVTGT